MHDLKHRGARLLAAGERASRAVAGPLRTRYPGFLFGLPLPRNEVPIFNYHEVAPETLEPDLDYLRENGYATLSLREFLQTMQAGARRRRAVLLTFDDAWSSFWTVAFPLLRKYQMRAVLFAPTYWMDGHGPDGLFMGWDQLRDCAASGFVEVQSHAHRHALVHTSARLHGFATPESLARTHFFNWPMREDDPGLGPPPPGTPVYGALPLLSATRRYIESAEAVRACRSFVAEQTDSFFSDSDAEGELRRHHAEVSARNPGRWATQEELEREMIVEFDRSRERFEDELGYAPPYFAYPWMLGNRRSFELARRAGLTAAFGVGVDFRRARRRGLPLPVY
ncbi:MAG TPA: polysaccharide deacetylase family protein, partial [Woeseiaceae bacterium]|nr:polysaccharide deacetylase family protein [Woeseiaceae bacterium]